MNIFYLKSKIHRATVTHTELDYEGSIAICPELIRKAEMIPFEKVHIYNINNGQRFSTYIICANTKGQIGLNGAAARCAMKGDKIIIATYCMLEENEKRFIPKVVFVGKNNTIKSI